MTQTITVKSEGVMLDQILVGVYGYVGQNILDLTLEANKGLLGKTILPIGTEVIIPDLPEEDNNTNQIKTVSLFD